MKCNVLRGGLVQPEPFVDHTDHTIHARRWDGEQQTRLNMKTEQCVVAMTLRSCCVQTWALNDKGIVADALFGRVNVSDSRVFF